ncbi:unnamed protein product [Arabis nemorensis]|uniref:Uncharacterized protein n=1 Tax=Arabis nemorensis TaxID=586526 RepID=A0A565BWV1_9BRAS|nr:unnamed protein product [Arabis nemorensis]
MKEHQPIKSFNIKARLLWTWLATSKTAVANFNALSIRILSSVSGDDSNNSKEENATAILLVASQKTLPVMVAVVEQLRGAFGESGLLIMIDSILVNLWLRTGKSSSSTNVKTS